MRRPLEPSLVSLAICVALSACGGSVDETGSRSVGDGGSAAGSTAENAGSAGSSAGGGGASGGRASPVWEGEPSGAFVSTFVACQRITDAYQRAAEERRCGDFGTSLGCPGFLANGKSGCFDYDLGTVAYCADVFVPKLSCAELASSPCQLVARETKCVEGD